MKLSLLGGLGRGRGARVEGGSIGFGGYIAGEKVAGGGLCRGSEGGRGWLRGCGVDIGDGSGGRGGGRYLCASDVCFC